MFIRKKTYDDIMGRLSLLEAQRQASDAASLRLRERIQEQDQHIRDLDSLVDYWVGDLKREQKRISDEVLKSKRKRTGPKAGGFFRRAWNGAKAMHWYSPRLDDR